MNDLQWIFEQLHDRYPLSLTNTLSVDDGFTDDIPIIIGRNAASDFWLYDYDGLFVFSIEVPNQPWRDHWHPRDKEEAMLAIIHFMENAPH